MDFKAITTDKEKKCKSQVQRALYLHGNECSPRINPMKTQEAFPHHNTVNAQGTAEASDSHNSYTLINCDTRNKTKFQLLHCNLVWKAFRGMREENHIRTHCSNPNAIEAAPQTQRQADSVGPGTNLKGKRANEDLGTF